MSIEVNATEQIIEVNATGSTIDINVSTQTVDVNATTSVIEVTASYNPGINLPIGGTTGQVLKKQSNTDYDTYWANDEKGVPYIGATGDVDLGEYELKAGQIELDQSPTGTAGVAVTRWNDAIGSTETTLKGGNVILKNGVDLIARVVNKVTPNTTLTKAAYQAVKVSGAQGQRLAIALAQANNDNNSADTLGLVTETIPTNQEGFIMTVGNLEGINTTGSLQGETWTDGDVLYLSPTTPGAITNVKPNGSTGHIVVIGYVEYAHQNNGKIYVKIMNGWELDELHNVFISSPANNDALIYESSTSLWKNKSIATALGYTPVPSTRSLTINGTSYDLSADRTWSVGTVTSVALSVPTGLVVTGGSPITTSGTIAVGLQSGYSIPTTVKQGNWDDAYTFVSAFPSQSGNSGKYLTTDGSTLSWGTVSTANIYNSDGTLTGNRTLTSGGFNLTFTGSNTAASAIARGLNLTHTLIAAANNDVLVGLDINPTFTNGAFTSVANIGLRVSNSYLVVAGDYFPASIIPSKGLVFEAAGGTGRITSRFSGADAQLDIKASSTRILSSLQVSNINTTSSNNNFFGNVKVNYTADAGGIQASFGIGLSTDNDILFYGAAGKNLFISAPVIRFTNQATTTEWGRFFGTGNLLIQTGGTFADAGYKLDVQGTGRFTGNLRIGSSASIVFEGNDFIYNTSSNGFRFTNTGMAVVSSSSATSKFLFDGRAVIGASDPVSASSQLEVNSTTKGFLPPRMTGTQRDAIVSPATGLSVYNTTTNTSDFYNGTSWVSLAAGNIYTADGTLTGNRTVTMGGNSLTFSGGTLQVGNTSTWETYINSRTSLAGVLLRANFGVANQMDLTFDSFGYLNMTGASFSAPNILGTTSLQTNGRVQLNGNNKTAYWVNVTDQYVMGMSGNTFVIRAASSSLTTGGALVSTSFSNGNITFGGSTDAGYKLDVQGTGRFTGDLAITSIIGNSIASSATSYFLNVSNSSGVILAQFNNNGTSAKILDGNVQFTTGTTINSVSHASVIIGVSHIYGSTGGANGGQYFAAVDNAANSTRYMVGHGSKGLKVELSPTATWETSALLQVSSTTKGFLPPRMTSAQRAAISTPATGLIVYQTDGTEGLYENTSTGWRILYNTPSGGSGITRSVNNISTTTTAAAAASTDYVYLISGTTTLTLPTAAGNTNRYTLKNVGTGTVTINTTSSQTIDGSTSITMAVQYTALDVISDGTNWNII